jgi:hypothetical protein
MTFIPRIPDLTNLIRARVPHVEANDESEYPETPSEGDRVFDKSLDVMKAWTGEKWIVVMTRHNLDPNV